MPGKPSAALRTLAKEHRVSTEWWDWQGRHREVAESTLRAVLAALGVAAADEAEVASSLAMIEDAAWQRVLPPVLVGTAGKPHELRVHVPDGTRFEATLELEDGTTRKLSGTGERVPARTVDGVRVGAAVVAIPVSAPTGYHQVVVTRGTGRRHTMPLILVPTRLALPAELAADGAQWWGLMTQLYAMRSQRSWGIGDLGDLGDAGAWGAGMGADFVLVNPVHAAEVVAPIEPSPYLPTSRRFRNPLMIRVEEIPEIGYLSAAQRQLVEWHGDDARRFLDVDFIDRDQVWASKEAALRLIFAAPLAPRRRRLFQAYCEQQGQHLLDFATWSALSRVHGPDWRLWPPALRRPAGEEVERFRDEHALEIEFGCWLQWVLHEQAETVQQDLRRAGMRLGVIHDLAVGVHPDGADSWMLQETLATGVTVGAPPDQYNQRGQDWSQPPWSPGRLAEAGYAPYRDVVRAAMAGGGGLRVDHIIGLFRLWCIPAGADPTEGTYVGLDHEALVGILMLEAERAGSVVIGEDLGTVEPWVRDYLSERGILGTSILWFESADSGSEPRPPESYREQCLSTVTTHDLPPTAGYLEGQHLVLRDALGLLTRPLEQERGEDEGWRRQVLAAVQQRGLVTADADVAAQVLGLHAYLASTPSKLLGVSVSDLALDRRIINQPGTDEEYPNWRVPLAGPEGYPVLLDDLITWRSARRLARTMLKSDPG